MHGTYNARYYDPAIGRFISADTIVPGVGPLTVAPSDATAAQLWGSAGNGAANPQTLNRYSYVLNNPINATDPTGHILTLNADAADFLGRELIGTLHNLRTEFKNMRDSQGWLDILGANRSVAKDAAGAAVSTINAISTMASRAALSAAGVAGVDALVGGLIDALDTRDDYLRNIEDVIDLVDNLQREAAGFASWAYQPGRENEVMTIAINTTPVYNPWEYNGCQAKELACYDFRDELVVTSRGTGISYGDPGDLREHIPGISGSFYAPSAWSE